MRRNDLAQEDMIVEVLDYLLRRFCATQLHVNLVLRQLHVTIFDLVSRHDRLERVDQLSSVVPLHSICTQHNCSLLCTWRLCIDARSLEVLSLRLQRSHHAGLVGYGKLNVGGDEGARRHALLCILHQGRTHTVLRALRCFL